MSEDVLVIAFDGLDKELIEEFGLENIQQEEFGAIDNETKMSSIKTAELFASFITGSNYTEHGIKGIRRWSNSRKGKLVELITPNSVVDRIKGLRTLREVISEILSVKKIHYSQEDLCSETLFEEIDNSRAMFVPSYSPSVFWRSECDTAPLHFGYDNQDAVEHYDSREHMNRKRKLFRELDSDIIGSRNFLMCHIHRSDFHQHMYGDEDGLFDRNKLRKLYREIDELAYEIREKAADSGYDRIIFMSDHGTPKGDSHNTNAFYSCNRTLFENYNPRITEFHDKIIELT